MRRLDRPTLIIAAAALAALGIIVFFLGLHSRAGGRLASLESALDEMRGMQSEYLILSGRVDALDRRKGLTRVEGIVQAVDTVFEPLGLNEKVESVKQLQGSDTPGEQKADVSVEGVSMNEMVNFLYAVENSPMLLLIRKIQIKTSFLNPGELNITLTLSLIKPE